jgi:hypothetical protein
MRTLLPVSVALTSATLVSGCASSAGRAAQTALRTATIRMQKTNVHFGHSTAQRDDMLVHPDWIDGCTGSLVGTGEPFAIWWNNNEIRDLPLRFEAGKTYLVEFRGEMGTGIMGYEGKCLHVQSIVKSQEAK